ncbi:MAG TPA: iron ABC transporter substrate-binding protein [Methylocella sp.]|nr:iron ABC transporter substrate-binding protein [Methylocella sp.]
MLSRRSVLLLPVALKAGFIRSAFAGGFTDSAGRLVSLPGSVKRIIPAGPPAEALLYSLAPETLLGLVEPWTDSQRKEAIPAARDLPNIPRVTRGEGALAIEAIKVFRPDLIIDYGAIDERYMVLADRVQSEVGIPYLLLDGRLAKVPEIVGRLGSILHRQERADLVAKTAESVLRKLALLNSNAARGRVSVYYARGSDGMRAVRAGSSLSEAIELAGGRNVITSGEGAFSMMKVDDVAALEPSVVVLADPKAAEIGSPLRKALSRETHFLVDPGLPYGWIERPPSLNRLIGALWLASRLYPKEITFSADDARMLNATLFHQVQTNLTIGQASQ